jgi:aspartyl-tRNA synthetase
MQVSDVFLGSNFKVFADTLENGGVIKALCVPGGAAVFSNTDLKKGTVYTEASKAGAKGLPFLKVMDTGKNREIFALLLDKKLWHCLNNSFVYNLLSQGSLKELVHLYQV